MYLIEKVSSLGQKVIIIMKRHWEYKRPLQQFLHKKIVQNVQTSDKNKLKYRIPVGKGNDESLRF